MTENNTQQIQQEKDPLSRFLLYFFLSPLVFCLLFAGILILSRGSGKLPSPVVLGGLLVVLYILAFSVFFVFRALIFSFFSGLAEKTCPTPKTKKKKQTVEEEAPATFRLFHPGQGGDVLVAAADLCSAEREKQAARFKKLAGFWELGKTSHFFFPVHDSFYQEKIKKLKKARPRMGDIQYGLVVIQTSIDAVGFEKPKDLFQKF